MRQPSLPLVARLLSRGPICDELCRAPKWPRSTTDNSTTGMCTCKSSLLGHAYDLGGDVRIKEKKMNWSETRSCDHHQFHVALTQKIRMLLPKLFLKSLQHPSYAFFEPASILLKTAPYLLLGRVFHDMFSLSGSISLMMNRILSSTMTSTLLSCIRIIRVARRGWRWRRAQSRTREGRSWRMLGQREA